MNVLFLSKYDPKNIYNWSGTLYHIYHKLKEKNTIEIIGTEIIEQLNLFSFSLYHFFMNFSCEYDNKPFAGSET